MSTAAQHIHFSIGWDVGGWNCDNNGRSRDAVVILDDQQRVAGSWRGNLRKTINKAMNSIDWLRELFSLCDANFPQEPIRATLAIDTPLGFSKAFTQLVTKLVEYKEPIGQSDTNPYLFRETEQFLFDHGLKPLSAVKDMIGSQATKGMHVLARFAPKVLHCGVWTDGDMLTVIEAYPSACKNSEFIQNQLQEYLLCVSIDPPFKEWEGGVDHPDKLDALVCALIANAFLFQPNALVSPPDSIPAQEGWIWVPKDGLRYDVPRYVLIDP